MITTKPQHQLTVKELLSRRQQQRYSLDVPISTAIDTSLHPFEIRKDGLPVGVSFSNLHCAITTADELISHHKYNSESVTIYDSQNYLDYRRIAGKWVVVGLRLE